MTEWQTFVERWKGGCGSGLCGGRAKVVLARGDIPADILFIGEAPGESEQVLGQPFVGPAGHLLDQIIRRSVPSKLSLCFTNLVGCIPWEEGGGKAAEPPAEAIKQCAPRLNDFVRIIRPQIIVLVGQLASKHVHGQSQFSDREDGAVAWISPGKFLELVTITHPAAILRTNISQRGLMIQKAALALADVTRSVFP